LLSSKQLRLVRVKFTPYFSDIVPYSFQEFPLQMVDEECLVICKAFLLNLQLSDRYKINDHLQKQNKRDDCYHAGLWAWERLVVKFGELLQV